MRILPNYVSCNYNPHPGKTVPDHEKGRGALKQHKCAQEPKMLAAVIVRTLGMARFLKLKSIF
jgi:hypothetical protein